MATRWKSEFRIDLDELRAQRGFNVPPQTRPKRDPMAHGTEIVISKLKPEQRQWFARAANVSGIRKQLAKAYSALLSPETGRAVFRLELNGTRIQARRHCVWSGDRAVENTQRDDSRCGALQRAPAATSLLHNHCSGKGHEGHG